DKTIPGAARWTLVLNGEAALDKETGLVWQRNTDDTARDWYAASSHCYGLEVGGRKGWRLPTIEELATLVDTSQSNPALPSGHPFINARSNYYWSGTTRASNPDSAWGVYFDYGYVGTSSKGNNNYVRCVRAGS
ncbi:MAG: DUF1566 domain-containing protein, partial [Desulfoferrobacter sp.]